MLKEIHTFHLIDVYVSGAFKNLNNFPNVNDNLSLIFFFLVMWET